MIQMSPCDSCPDFWPECECPARQAWMFEQERAGLPAFPPETDEEEDEPEGPSGNA